MFIEIVSSRAYNGSVVYMIKRSYLRILSTQTNDASRQVQNPTTRFSTQNHHCGLLGDAFYQILACLFSQKGFINFGHVHIPTSWRLLTPKAVSSNQEMDGIAVEAFQPLSKTAEHSFKSFNELSSDLNFNIRRFVES